MWSEISKGFSDSTALPRLCGISAQLDAMSFPFLNFVHLSCKLCLREAGGERLLCLKGYLSSGNSGVLPGRSSLSLFLGDSPQWGSSLFHPILHIDTVHPVFPVSPVSFLIPPSLLTNVRSEALIFFFTYNNSQDRQIACAKQLTLSTVLRDGCH